MMCSSPIFFLFFFVLIYLARTLVEWVLGGSISHHLTDDSLSGRCLVHACLLQDTGGTIKQSKYHETELEFRYVKSDVFSS